MIKPAQRFGWYYAKSEDLTEETVKLFRQLPGVRWDSARKHWVIPTTAMCFTETGGLNVTGPIATTGELSPRLRPFQREDVLKCLALKKLVNSSEMGLGKTVEGAELLRLIDPDEPVLIVCPATSRKIWTDHLDGWWPDHPYVHQAETIKDVKAFSGGVLICSFDEEVLQTVPRKPYRVIIVDESHKLKNAKAQCSIEMRDILKSAQPEYVFFMTGTPIDNEPVDLHNQADLLYPGCFGHLTEFKKRYCLSEDDQHAYSGKKYFGLNPEIADELAQRFATISIRRTKAEVAEQLPSLTTKVIKVQGKRQDLRELLENLARPDKHRAQAPSQLLHACGDQKFLEAERLALKALEETTHVAVITHRRELASRFAKHFYGLGYTAFAAHEASSIKQRHVVLERATNSRSAILCSTMHSISTGLSLTAFNRVVYAELDWRPSEVSQSMARWHRVNGIKDVVIYVPVIMGTVEEAIADAVMQKLSDQGLIYASGVVDGRLKDALADESQLLAALSHVAADRIKEDPYL